MYNQLITCSPVVLTVAFQQSSYTVEENMTPLEVCVVIATPNSLDAGLTAVIQVDSMAGTATGIHNTHSTNNQGAYLHNTSLLVAYNYSTNSNNLCNFHVL